MPGLASFSSTRSSSAPPRRCSRAATTFHVHLTQTIAIGAGQPAQPIHRDQWAFDFFPFPDGYDVQCNTIWALTDFTEANGATRVVPGSNRGSRPARRLRRGRHRAGRDARGSVLVYSGSVHHGGGANRTDDDRIGVNLTYAAVWLRQEENQYLSVPLEVARPSTTTSSACSATPAAPTPSATSTTSATPSNVCVAAPDRRPEFGRRSRAPQDLQFRLRLVPLVPGRRRRCGS